MLVIRLMRSIAAALLLVLAPMIGMAQTISQPLDSSGGITNNPGQAFVATLTGTVVAIDVREALGSHLATLHIYNGPVGSGVPGAVGAPAYSMPGVTLTQVASGGAFSHITLTTPFPVVAGQTYSFVLSNAGLWARFTDVYPGGTALGNFATPQATLDLAFQIFEVAAAADLQISQVASSVAATVGSTVSYVVTFTNAGPGDAGTVTVADNLAAAGLVLLSAQSSIGVLTTSSNSLSLAVGTLTSGASGTVTVVASVSAGAGSITHTVTIGAASPDPTPANNTSVHFASRLAAPVAPAGPAAIPTLSQWAMIVLAMLLAGSVCLQRKPLRRKNLLSNR